MTSVLPLPSPQAVLPISRDLWLAAGCRKVCGVGPGIPFAQHLLDRRLAQAVGLVPTAVGATAISEWLPGTRLFRQMVFESRPM